MSFNSPVPGKDGNRYVPFEDRTGGSSEVFFTRDLSEEGLKKIYKKVSAVLCGKVAVKLHTGEAEGPNIIPRPWVKELLASELPGASIIETGLLERHGIKVAAIGGHPEGHPVMSSDERWQALQHKCQRIEARGMAPLIVTQFAFDADTVLTWLDALRTRGITVPVLVGVPGPASITRLLRYAAMCGVGASASMLARYGISIGRLLGTAGPEVFVDRLVKGLTSAHGQVSPHLFPFGGVAPSLEWIERYRQRVRGARGVIHED